jgi:hypothetical protein
MPFFEKGVEAFASVYDLFFFKQITSSSSIVPNSSDDLTSDSESLSSEDLFQDLLISVSNGPECVVLPSNLF